MFTHVSYGHDGMTRDREGECVCGGGDCRNNVLKGLNAKRSVRGQRQD